MFSSFWSAPADPTAQNFFPVSSRYVDSDILGPLEPKDTEWTCAGGFAVETQTFYCFTENGTSIMVQIIYSSVGLWPTTQLVTRIFDPNTKETIWRSINVTNFYPGEDKRSSKSDQFTVTHKSTPGAEFEESYSILGRFGDDLQVSVDIKRPAAIPGFKIGKGPKGGFSYFGPDIETPEGYVVHRFWPRFQSTGIIVNNGQATTFAGTGMFVHAIQGMRPNLVAASWNFAHFQSDEHGGVSAVQMELTTIDTYGKNGVGSGKVVVNVGSLVVGGKLAAVTAETKWPGEPVADKPPVLSRAIHHDKSLDDFTGYDVPSTISFHWAGPSVIPGAEGSLIADLSVQVGKPGEEIGLIEKVDVMAEIPGFVKAVVSYVAGTKPYIYQWLNPTTLKITGPDALVPGLSGGLEVKGRLYNEATFIS